MCVDKFNYRYLFDGKRYLFQRLWREHFFDNYVFYNRIFAISLPDKENTLPNLPEKVYSNLFSMNSLESDKCNITTSL